MKRFHLLASMMLLATAACSAGEVGDGVGVGGESGDGQGDDGQGDGLGDGVTGSGTGTLTISEPLGSDCVSSGEEICDGIDNDCNGKIDDGIDYSRVQSCGNCQTDCTRASNVKGPTCEPPEELDGVEAGRCSFDECAVDYFDLDGDKDNGCEYYCAFNPTGANDSDDASSGCGIDDDCDGLIDEDVDLCTDADNCGVCGRGCSVEGVHATFQCVSRAGDGNACTGQNTACEIDGCEDGYFDSNGDPADGCEYLCTPTGPEVCDGIDNDCDRLIDNADPDLEVTDEDVGDVCFGGDEGVCAQAMHSGVTKCVGGAPVCCDRSSNDEDGTNPALPVNGLRNGICDVPSSVVLHPGDREEVCNGLDDDCDGAVDDAPTDTGAGCGSNQGSCSPGTMQCSASGKLTCMGASVPGVEICNGVDDDCDGIVDGTLQGAPVSCSIDDDCPGTERCLHLQAVGNVCAAPSADSIGSCDEPTTPHDSPCRAGQLSCQSGALSCRGSTGPQGADICGEDTNCDGVLSNQPDFDTDVTACGGCNTDCTANYPGQVVACVAGACEVQGCKAGRIDCGGADSLDCETSCTKISDTETCNGVDDDCNCQIDDIAPEDIPGVTEVCGVSGGASDAGCLDAAVSCSAGKWACQFAPGYCEAGGQFPCAGVLDLCDDKDNDCDGNTDEDISGKGTTCYSDEGLPAPHGACQTSATRICDPQDSSRTLCPAQKNLSAVLTEVCDGLDNDCDGSVDEASAAPGSDPSYVAPAVAQLSPSLWIMSHEASRPAATSSDPGTGNGYWFPALTPSGLATEATLACSEAEKVPWFNVTPAEAAQTCSEVGGRLCTVGEWQGACEAASACNYGYASSCSGPGAYPGGSPSCNVAENYGAGTPALLPTADGSLDSCYAALAGGEVYDITGNLREIVWDDASSDPGCVPEDPEETGCVFRVMGGTYQSVEAAGACSFDFFAADASFKLYNSGFRCCFDADPT